MVTSKMILLTGLHFSETQVVDPVSSVWRDSLLYVFAFIVKTDTHCSVNLQFVPVSEESDSQFDYFLCLVEEGTGYGRYSYTPNLEVLHTSCRGRTKGCQLVNHANRKFHS